VVPGDFIKGEKRRGGRNWPSENWGAWLKSGKSNAPFFSSQRLESEGGNRDATRAFGMFWTVESIKIVFCYTVN
jgi:hypothetical protein